MLCGRVILFCGVFLISQALTTAGDEAWAKPSIESLVWDFVTAAANGNRVLWWDIKGEQDVLKSNPFFSSRRVRVTTGPIVYGEDSVISVRAPDTYEYWVHNDRYNKTITETVRMGLAQKRTYKWTVDDVYALHEGINVTVVPPQTAMVRSRIEASLELQRGSLVVQREVVQMVPEEVVALKPRTSSKLTWTVNYVAKNTPWTMNVTLRGWVAVWYKNKVSDHHLWFYPIDFITGGGIQHIPGGGIQFTAKGTFTAVTAETFTLRIEAYTRSSEESHVSHRNVKTVHICAQNSDQCRQGTPASNF